MVYSRDAKKAMLTVPPPLRFDVETFEFSDGSRLSVSVSDSRQTYLSRIPGEDRDHYVEMSEMQPKYLQTRLFPDDVIVHFPVPPDGLDVPHTFTAETTVAELIGAAHAFYNHRRSRKAPTFAEVVGPDSDITCMDAVTPGVYRLQLYEEVVW